MRISKVVNYIFELVMVTEGDYPQYLVVEESEKCDWLRYVCIH